MSSLTFEIEKLYVEFFGRAADTAGLQVWTNYINQGHSLTDVAHGMEGSPEYHAAYTQTWESGVPAAIDRAAMNMFDRPATASELVTFGSEFYGALFNHTSTADVILHFAASAAGADLQHLLAKVEAATPVALVGVQAQHFDAHHLA